MSAVVTVESLSKQFRYPKRGRGLLAATDLEGDVRDRVDQDVFWEDRAEQAASALRIAELLAEAFDGDDG